MYLKVAVLRIFLSSPLALDTSRQFRSNRDLEAGGTPLPGPFSFSLRPEDKSNPESGRRRQTSADSRANSAPSLSVWSRIVFSSS